MPLKLKAGVGRSEFQVAAVDVGPAAVAALVLTLLFPALLLAALLVPAVALPLPSAVVEGEPAVAPPNVGVEAAAPAKAEKPTLFPEEAKVKPPNAGGSAASPGGLGSAAGASSLPAQHQLW